MTLKILVSAIAGLVAVVAVIVLAGTSLARRSDSDARHAGKGSIMQTGHDRMSIFSADNVRLLSEAQIRAIEEVGDHDTAS